MAAWGPVRALARSVAVPGDMRDIVKVALPSLRRYGIAGGFPRRHWRQGAPLGILIRLSVILGDYAMLTEQNNRQAVS